MTYILAPMYEFSVPQATALFAYGHIGPNKDRRIRPSPIFPKLRTHWRQHRATGEVIVVRYADDAVLGFQHRADAEQLLHDWKERLGRFGLEPHPDTTDRVRALRSREPKREWRREAGDVQLPGLHPHLWGNLEDRQIPRSTQDHPQAALCQIESAEGGASKTQTSVCAGAREMVEVRCTGILQLSS